jgi:hypothetical protein
MIGVWVVLSGCGAIRAQAHRPGQGRRDRRRVSPPRADVRANSSARKSTRHRSVCRCINRRRWRCRCSAGAKVTTPFRCSAAMTSSPRLRPPPYRRTRPPRRRSNRPRSRRGGMWASRTTGSRRASCAGPRAKDGLRIYPGQVGQGPMIASPSTPQSDDPLFVWAVLDCPSAYAIASVDHGTQIVVLAALTVELRQPPRAGEPHVVAAWPVGSEAQAPLGLCALRRRGTRPRHRRLPLDRAARSRRLRPLSPPREGLRSLMPLPSRTRRDLDRARRDRNGHRAVCLGCWIRLQLDSRAPASLLVNRAATRSPLIRLRARRHAHSLARRHGQTPADCRILVNTSASIGTDDVARWTIRDRSERWPR